MRIIGERIDDKHLLGSLLVADVTFSQVRAAHEELAELADAGQLPTLIQHQELYVFDSPA